MGHEGINPGIARPASARLRRLRWLAALGAALAVLVTAGVLGWRVLLTYFTSQYYRNSYAPVQVTRGAAADLSPLRASLRSAVYTRRGDAAFLRLRFADGADLSSAASLLDAAAGRYQSALDALEAGDLTPAEAARVGGWLREAAAAEREAARAFLARADASDG